MERVSRLIVQLGSEVVETVELRATVSIGRLPDSGVVLAGMRVSGRHAELRREPEGFVLVDLGSPFGTLLDGVRLVPNRPYLLPDGCGIQIDLYLLTYRSEAVREVPEGEITCAKPEPVPDPVSAPATAKPGPGCEPRPTLRPFTPPREWTSTYLQYLPVIFHENPDLSRFLLIFESIWEPLEQRQDQINMYFDPKTCPAGFLPWLANWSGIELNPHWPEARVRALLPVVLELYRWRGTEYGLSRMIEVCTGIAPRITWNPSDPFVLRISCQLPGNGSADRKLLEELINLHKPAHTGYVLEVRQ